MTQLQLTKWPLILFICPTLAALVCCLGCDPATSAASSDAANGVTAAVDQPSDDASALSAENESLKSQLESLQAENDNLVRDLRVATESLLAKTAEAESANQAIDDVWNMLNAFKHPVEESSGEELEVSETANVDQSAEASTSEAESTEVAGDESVEEIIEEETSEEETSEEVQIESSTDAAEPDKSDDQSQN